MAVVVVVVVRVVVVVDLAIVTNRAEFFFTIITTTITAMVIVDAVARLVKRIFHFRRQYWQLNTRKREREVALSSQLIWYFTVFLIEYEWRVLDRADQIETEKVENIMEDIGSSLLSDKLHERSQELD